jgi:DNA-binding transcriptional LysR family regulator
MHVTLGQLRAFERIVRLGSFHAAALELKLSQPSVSQRIRELEGALQTPLFVRRGPRIGLTAEGHALVEYADRMLTTAGELVERFRTRDPLKGTLRLGVNETFAFICLPDLLKRMEQQYPAIRTSVFVGDTGIVSARLNDQALDIAVVSEPTVAPHVSQEPLGSNAFGWFASTSLTLPRRTFTPADLEHYQLLVPPPPARLHATVAKWFAEASVKPRRISTCNSIHATAETIAQGAAIGVVPVRIMHAAVEKRGVRLLKMNPPLPSHQVAICYQIREFGPGLKVLVQLIRELASRNKLFV